MIQKPEHRKSERKPFNKNISFECNDREKMFQVMHKSGLSIDISTGGLGLKTDHHLKKGDVVKVDMPLSEEGIMVPLFAEVVWSTPLKDHCQAGLRFLA